MAAIKGNNQSPYITQKYLNTATYAGDPTPGAVVSTSQVSGSIVQPYAGMVGGILTLSESEAATRSDPAYQNLYAGDYQYVQFYASSVNTAVQGQPVFLFKDQGQGETITVTPDYAPGVYGSGLVFGIALENTAKGNYWFVQISGVAQVLFATANNVTSPSVGDLIYVDYSTPSARALDPTQSGNPTNAQLALILGRAWSSNPKASTISPVMLTGFFGYTPGAGGA
jgi:Uncharacterized conserved protein (DUF2190)